MKPIVSAAEMRAIDTSTIVDVGLPGAVLMENAGRAVADEVMVILGDRLSGGRVVVIAGTGNNGGDGHVAARVLGERGVQVSLYLIGRRDQVGGDAALHFVALENCGGHVEVVESGDELAEHRAAMGNADVVVDALFGTGLARPVEGYRADVIEMINECAGAVVSVDIPSGLSADSGRELGIAVDADVTVTMACLKRGLAVSPGFARCGRVLVAEIGIPERLAVDVGATTWLVEPHDVAERLPVGDLLEHKHRRGHIVVIGGWPGMRGAGRLAAMSALRAGAGLVTLAAPDPDSLAPDVVMTSDLEAIESLLQRAGVVVCGPGVPEAGSWLTTVLERELPTVLDAGTLRPGVLEHTHERCVLTPHPGEAARLLGVTSAEVQKDRLEAVKRLSDQAGSTVVLKGARSLITDRPGDEGHVYVDASGGVELATAGSGDVLSGIIAAMLARGAAPIDAAIAGVGLHGTSGRLAAESRGGGVVASDLVEAIGAARNDLALL